MIFLRAVIHFIFSLILVFSFPAMARGQESLQSKIVKAGTIRCAYWIVPPEFDKEPNTGRFSGIAYEIMEEVGKALDLKIEWTEEVSLSTALSGLQTRRYDAVCSSIWDRADFGKQADFSIPFMYTPVATFVRANDPRFDENASRIDDPDVTIATMDGENSQIVARQSYPRAKTFSLPETSHVSLMLESVATGKADVAFTYPGNFFLYDKNNPGKLKIIHKDMPVKAFGSTIMIPQGEYELKRMLDTALSEILNSGQVDRIIDKYESHPGTYYRIQKPYRVPE